MKLVMFMTIVFTVSDNVKNRMISFYADKRRQKTPPYAIFQADDADTNITLYNSGKVVFQGNSADIEAQIWKDLEMSLNNRNIDSELKKSEDKKKDKVKEETDLRFRNVATIGSDEVGTGDYFGPIVVTASYVSKENIKEVMNLGVKDSKKITDDIILKIGPKLIKTIPHSTYILDNQTYNKYPTNMNKIKAILHNKVLVNMVRNNYNDVKYVVVDQFCFPKNYFGYLKEANNVFRKIDFTTKAEDKCLSVACGSLISRYIFIKEMDKISKMLGKNVPKGAGITVDEFGKEIVKKYGKDILKKTAKLNFKNTDKILKD